MKKSIVIPNCNIINSHKQFITVRAHTMDYLSDTPFEICLGVAGVPSPDKFMTYYLDTG